MSSSRGSFIVFEGLDRSGKSTQVSRLVSRLEKDGRKVRLQKFPDRTTAIGKMIDSYLQSKEDMDDHAIHLLFSANRWECAAAIRSDLADGVTIIADRYAFSGIAFSAAKGLDFDYCLKPDTSLPLPDITLYLTLPPNIAEQRGAYGEERYETIDIQTRVREQFSLVASQVKERHGEKRWMEISAEGSRDDVENRIWEVVKNVVDRNQKDDVGDLWV